MGSPPVIPNGKGAAAVMVAAWASWVPAVSVVCVGAVSLVSESALSKLCANYGAW